MKVTSKVNKTNVSLLNNIMFKNLVKSVDAMKTDIQQSQVVPFDTGHMQNDSMFIDDTKSKKYVLLRVDTPYARKMYFHPEYNFKRNKNANAQGQWFTSWISGNKKLYLSIVFAKFMRKDLERYASKGH